MTVISQMTLLSEQLGPESTPKEEMRTLPFSFSEDFFLDGLET